MKVLRKSKSKKKKNSRVTKNRKQSIKRKPIKRKSTKSTKLIKRQKLRRSRNSYSGVDSGSTCLNFLFFRGPDTGCEQHIDVLKIQKWYELNKKNCTINMWTNDPTCQVFKELKARNILINIRLVDVLFKDYRWLKKFLTSNQVLIYVKVDLFKMFLLYYFYKEFAFDYTVVCDLDLVPIDLSNFSFRQCLNTFSICFGLSESREYFENQFLAIKSAKNNFVLDHFFKVYVNIISQPDFYDHIVFCKQEIDICQQKIYILQENLVLPLVAFLNSKALRVKDILISKTIDAVPITKLDEIGDNINTVSVMPRLFIFQKYGDRHKFLTVDDLIELGLLAGCPIIAGKLSRFG